MKLSSVSYLNHHAQKTLYRFPLVILMAIVAASFGNYLIEFNEDLANPFPLINLMLTSALGIPLLFCTKIFIEKKQLKAPFTHLLPVISLAFLVTVYFLLPDGSDTESVVIPYYRYAIFSICIHLTVAFLPYLKTGETLGFWNYNSTLFLQLLKAMLYSLVLYIGIVLAILAMHLLFEIAFDDKIYLQLFVLIFGVFHTWLFLSGIPEDLKRMDHEVSYTAGLKAFTQYIMLSLLVVYLLILYGYSLKILISWDWPLGIVAYLIIFVATWGILTVLLLYPFRASKEDKWIRTFSQVYYFVLFPLVVMLFLAIGIRISDYGITINRYLIVLLGCWLTLICFYFKLGFKSIKIIPFSLACMLLFASFGPWGIFEVSERSQFRRLRSLLMETHLLEDEKATNEVFWDMSKLPELVPVEGSSHTLLAKPAQVKEIYSITRYLEDHHGLASMEAWFSQHLDTVLLAINQDLPDWNKTEATSLYLQTLGLPKNPNAMLDNSISLQADNSENQSINTQGYDYLKRITLTAQDTIAFKAGLTTYQVAFNPQKDGLYISSPLRKNTLEIQHLLAHLNQTTETITSNSSIPPDMLTLSTKQSGLKMKLEIHFLRYHAKNDSTILLDYLEGDLLFRDSIP